MAIDFDARQFKSLVITGNGASRIFSVSDPLLGHDSFLEITLARRRDLITTTIYNMSIDEVLTLQEWRCEDNKSHKRLPETIDPISCRF